ncbi:porin [Shewanella psychrotolerans]|uniref:porin n=1 Tax=Shewanella psychrotolerans TaxID=2864206 RepID=UPI001C66009C|nr:hypothetical protein [Shewanella psychrotolerans]QYK00463.1 hypothetical protein K0I62_13775 [Shewanella psychrotolerans]
MKLSKLVVGIAAFSCFSVFADNGFYGEANVMANWKDNLDQQTGIATGFAGYKDKVKVKDIDVSYQLEGYYAASGDRFIATNESDEFALRVASLIFSTDYGSFYVGKGYSGAYLNLYKRVDIHPFSNSEQYTMNKMLFRQGKYSDSIIAYVTPWYDSAMGKFQAKMALVNPNSNDGANDDVLVGRILYSAGKFNAVINLNRIDEKFSGNADNHHYNRYSFGADYTFNNLTLAYTGEYSENAFSATSIEGYSEQVHSVAISIKQDDFKYGLSYQLVNSELASRDDLGLVIGSVTYSYTKELDFMVEYAKYTGDNDFFVGGNTNPEDDSFTIGARFNF